MSLKGVTGETVTFASTLRILQPAEHVLAFYDGRVPGRRLTSDQPNWLDDGAYALGVCSYAVVSGADALVFDTHISLDHARAIRATLARAGVAHLRVVLSHWHRDHVAGNEVFQDCEIIAHALTAELMREKQSMIEGGHPPIRPLVMPSRTYEGALQLSVGHVTAELRHADIHSRDGTLLLIPDQDLLLAGDALEDPVTYVAEPDRLAIHLEHLHRIQGWGARRILPSHGDPDVIASGGYPPALIDATAAYIERLLLARTDPQLAREPLDDWLAGDLAAGTLRLFPPYVAVHQRNVEAVLALAAHPRQITLG